MLVLKVRHNHHIESRLYHLWATTSTFCVEVLENRIYRHQYRIYRRQYRIYRHQHRVDRHQHCIYHRQYRVDRHQYRFDRLQHRVGVLQTLLHHDQVVNV